MRIVTISGFYCIAESKLDYRFDDEDFKSINYNIHRRDRARRGGGLLLFIKKNVCVNFIKSDPVYEIVEMQLQTDQSERIVLLSCYRPQLNSEGFLDALEEKTMNYIGSADDIIIAGDLNYDMQLSSTPLHGFCGTLGLTNFIEKPSRLNLITLTMTLLDVI